MPRFEVTVEGARYEVEAPDESTAWQWASATHREAPAVEAPPPIAEVLPMAEVPLTEAAEFTGAVSPAGIPLRVGEGVPTIEEEVTVPEAIIGAGEAALALGTGATVGFAGQVYGGLRQLAREISEGKLGTQEAVRRVEQEAQKYGAALTYQPETEAGREYTQAVAETLAPLEALTPLAMQAGAIRRGAPRRAPKPVAALTETELALRAAAERGIPVMTTDIRPPRTFISKTVQQIGERVPMVGTGGLREIQQVKRIQAIQDVALQFGDEMLVSTIPQVAEALTKTRSKKITRFANLKKGVISKLSESEVPMSKTFQEIDNQVGILNQINTKASKLAAEALGDYRRSFSKQNLENIELVRKDLGNLFKSQDLVTIKDQGNKAVGQIYRAVNEDMGNYIKNVGESKDFSKWKVANKELSKLTGELESSALKSILKRSNIEPEAVERMLFSKKPSQIKLLYKNLDREGRHSAKIAIMHRAVENAGGIDNISPAKFKTQLTRLSNPMGVFFKGEDKALVEGLSKALSITKRADEFAASPPTGVQLTVPVGAAVLTDVLGGAGAGLATGGLVGAGLRLYETMPIKRALKRIGTVQKGTKEFELAVESLLTAIYATRQNREQE